MKYLPLHLGFVLALGGMSAWVGCAPPGPPPTSQVPPPGTSPSETTAGVDDGLGLQREVAELRARGDLESAILLLREQLTPGDTRSGELRLMLGEILERVGRDDEAAVEFAFVSGVAADSDDSAAAWEGLARIHERAFDPEGATRARLFAWESSGRRRSYEEPAVRAVQSLRTAALRQLERESRGRPAHEFIRTELADRLASTRHGDEFVIAVLAPLTGRFEQFGAAFKLGAELAFANRNSPPPELPLRPGWGPDAGSDLDPGWGLDAGSDLDLGSELHPGSGLDWDSSSDADSGTNEEAESWEDRSSRLYSLFRSRGLDPEPEEVPPPSPAPEPLLPIRLVFLDTEGDLAVAARVAAQAVVQEGAVAMVGPLLSEPALAAGAVAEAHRVPLIAPTATDPALREVGRFVLSLDASPRELVDPLASFAVNDLGGQRFGALVPSDGFSELYEREFRAAIEAYGGQMILSLAYDPTERDFRRLLDRFVDAEVDGLYIPGGESVLGSLASQLDFYDFDRRVLGHGGWTSPRILDAGNLALEGGLFSVSEAEYPDSPFMSRLRADVWNASRQEASRFHVRGWQAMEAVLAALDSGAREGEALVEVLSRREHWVGRPSSEEVHLLTYRDGVLGDAAWAVGFDLVPKTPPEPEEEEPEEEDAVDDPVEKGDPADPDPVVEEFGSDD